MASQCLTNPVAKGREEALLFMWEQMHQNQNLPEQCHPSRYHGPSRLRHSPTFHTLHCVFWCRAWMVLGNPGCSRYKSYGPSVSGSQNHSV